MNKNNNNSKMSLARVPPFGPGIDLAVQRIARADPAIMGGREL